MNKSVRFIAQAAIIAALYAAITLMAAPISFGHNIFQFRIAEALTILPALTTAAIPGLFAGCLIANLAGGIGSVLLIDVIFGSLTTLFAAFLSYLLRKKKALVPLPPVVLNAVIVGTYLYLLYFKSEFPNVTIYASIAWVGLGQLLACYLLGYPLLLFLGSKRTGLEKYFDAIDKKNT